MIAKKKTAKKRAAPALKIELAKRRKPGSKNATSFQAGNPHRYPEGVSGNPGGVPKNHRLLSRTARAMLSDPAPHALCRAIGVHVNSSYAICIAHRLVTLSAFGDLDATRLLSILTEGMHPRSGVDFALDELQRSEPAALLKICFIEADGSGYPKPGQFFDGKEFKLEDAAHNTPQPMLPAPQD